MKKFILLFTIALLFIGRNSLAQITVTDAHLVNIGDVIYQSYDDIPSSSITIGSTGINQSWDFSALQNSSTDTLFFVDPVITTNASLYSNVNLSMLQQGSVSYFNKTSSGMYLHGINDTVFNSPALYLPLPLTYGFTTSDGPIVVIEETITGNFLSSAISPATVYGLSGGTFNRADTALIQVTNTSDFTVDASGILTMPLGAYDALRLKTIQSTSSVLNVYCSDTLTGIGAWVPNIPFSSIPLLAGFSNDEQEIKYQWITNDASVEFLLVEIVTDALDNIIDGVSFQTIPSLSSVTELMSNTFDVYPIPTTDNLIVEAQNIKLTILELIDVTGKRVLTTQFSRVINLDLSQISKGIYYLNLKSTNGELTKKIIIE